MPLFPGTDPTDLEICSARAWFFCEENATDGAENAENTGRPVAAVTGKSCRLPPQNFARARLFALHRIAGIIRSFSPLTQSNRAYIRTFCSNLHPCGFSLPVLALYPAKSLMFEIPSSVAPPPRAVDAQSDECGYREAQSARQNFAQALPHRCNSRITPSLVHRLTLDTAIRAHNTPLEHCAPAASFHTNFPPKPGYFKWHIRQRSGP